MASKSCDDQICSNDPNAGLKMLIGSTSNAPPSTPSLVNMPGPLNAIALGQSTWPLLHQMTFLYPEQPSEKDKLRMSKLFKSFSYLYPCIICAKDFRKEKKIDPPKLESREELVLWLCH
jgi:FAD-linked sulfhydryl oxidase